jgi:hypothetical protein
VVLVGTVEFGHLTLAGHTIDLPEVPSFVNNNVKLVAEALLTPKEKVKVQLAFNVAAKKLPSARFSVAALPVFPTFTSLSA